MPSISPDTQTPPDRIATDAPGPYPRITAAAIEHAKVRLGLDDLDALGLRLGFSRQSFWRLRTGRLDIRLSLALEVARTLGLPLQQVFDIPLHLVVLRGGSRG